MVERDILDYELQRIVDIIKKDDVEEMLAPGSQAKISEPENFITLPNEIFQSREDLLNIIRKIALRQGYATIIRRSKTNRYVVIGCDRGGNYRGTKMSLDEKKKKSASRLIGCPFELAKSQSYQSQCKGQFFKTMGMPCVHMMREMKVEVLALNDIHNQWRIDTKSFGNGHRSLDDVEDPIKGLVFNLVEKYHKLPFMQQEDTKLQLSQILGSPLPLILEPTVQPHKGRPLGSKKRKESSTKREPSKFETVEKSARKCGKCRNPGHNCRKCPNDNDEVAAGSSLQMVLDNSK